MESVKIFFATFPKKPSSQDIEANTETPTLDDDGFLAFSPQDPENPKNWSNIRRWYITGVCMLIVVNCTFASSAPTGSLFAIANHFGVSSVAANLITTLFLLGYCAGPLFWGPLSEFYGRRYIFYISFIGYFAFNFLCAWTPNFGGLLVGRFLTGTFASSALSNAPGILVDLFGPLERGNAMALFVMVVFSGPVVGPITSGFLALTEDWRWCFYELLWFAAGTLILIITIPETFAPQILTNKARRLRKAQISGFEDVKAAAEGPHRTLSNIFKTTLTRPWKLLIDPISLAVAVYFSIVYALLYMLFTIYPIVFQEMRGWNSGVGELPLIGLIIGAALGGGFVFWNTAREHKKILAGEEWTPEHRLPLAMVGAVIFPISLFWFAWSGNYNSVHWIVPTLAGVPLAMAILLMFVAFMNYLTDSYLMFAASAVAANTVCRSAAAAGAPLFTQQMFNALGVGGAGSLIAGIGVVLAPIPFLFHRYGGAIRKRSKYAPTPSAPKS